MRLQTSISSTPSTCGGTIADGTAQVAAVGGPNSNYTYLWNTGATTASITLLSAGTYSVIVTDANWCMAYDTVNVLAGPQPVLSIAVQNVSCFGLSDGSANVQVTGGTPPYSYSWSNGASTQNLSNVTSGHAIQILGFLNRHIAYLCKNFFNGKQR